MNSNLNNRKFNEHASNANLCTFLSNVIVLLKQLIASHDNSLLKENSAFKMIADELLMTLFIEILDKLAFISFFCLKVEICHRGIKYLG